jgi:hypothetical protein
VRKEDAHRYIFQAEIGLTGADDNIDLDNAGTYGAGYRDGETSGLPTLQARVAYGFELGGQKAEVGLWGDQAWEKSDTSFAGNDEFNSYAVGMDFSLPLYKDIVGLKTEIWTGENLDDVRGGIFQGVNKTTGKEIALKGGFVELSYKTSVHNSLYVGYSTDNPENSDLDVGGRAVNEIWYCASRWTYKPLAFGLEYLNWTTRYVGYGDGTDNRVAAFIAYNF